MTLPSPDAMPTAAVAPNRRRRLVALSRLLALTAAATAILVGLGIVFFLRVPLHCSVTTSFAAATFEMSPDDEDDSGAAPTAATFRHPYALPLRFGLSSLLLAFLFLPPGAALLLLRHSLSFPRWLSGACLLTPLVALCCLLPERLIGARYLGSLPFALILGALPLVLLTLSLGFCFLVRSSAPSPARAFVRSDA